NRRVRRTEQLRAGVVDQEVEGIGGDQRVAGHERQLGVDLTAQRKGLAAGAHLGDLRQQVGREIGIRAEAQQPGGCFTGRGTRDQLRGYVQGRVPGRARAWRV